MTNEPGIRNFCICLDTIYSMDARMYVSFQTSWVGLERDVLSSFLEWSKFAKYAEQIIKNARNDQRAKARIDRDTEDRSWSLSNNGVALCAIFSD